MFLFPYLFYFIFCVFVVRVLTLASAHAYFHIRHKHSLAPCQCCMHLLRDPALSYRAAFALRLQTGLLHDECLLVWFVYLLLLLLLLCCHLHCQTTSQPSHPAIHIWPPVEDGDDACQFWCFLTFCVGRVRGWLTACCTVSCAGRMADWQSDLTISCLANLDDASQRFGWLAGCLVAWLFGGLIAWSLAWHFHQLFDVGRRRCCHTQFAPCQSGESMYVCLCFFSFFFYILIGN